MTDGELVLAQAIGEKLREVRTSKAMSLRDLSSRAGVSASMLSQIETGKAYPSVRSIYSIAAAMEVPVDTFFPNPAKPEALPMSPPIDPTGLTAREMREAQFRQTHVSTDATFEAGSSQRPVVDPRQRPMIELAGGVTWARLTSLPEENAEFLEIKYAPGATSGSNMSQHNGREFGLILEGELEIELGFQHYTLRPGESIVFDSTTPHRLTNQTSIPMRALWVVLNQR
jgi:transcriptional regulator with XRE-family HTH domain/quercetin dioxygenase-like cupin family protein